MAYGRAPSKGIWLMVGHKSVEIWLMVGHKCKDIAYVRAQFWLILGTNWRFQQFLDAGLLVPYKGNNTESTPPVGFQLKFWEKVVLQTSLVSLKVCTIPFFVVFS
jgi:hypothetical protein